ncbi:hypothetical protein GCM10022224_095040 [Nonomuraea antimicrobica]|uniref:Chorismate lyase n=2 Tax=Nonomuraea antimicrobica TaxID=561173 RepID=A0ABP7E760_9ACTN
MTHSPPASPPPAHALRDAGGPQDAPADHAPPPHRLHTSSPAYRPAGLLPVPASSFTSAITRMLLASDGSTTLLLEALTGGPISVHLQSLTDQPAAGMPGDVRALLQLTSDATVTIRRSLLHDHHDTPLSRNEVITPPSTPLMQRIATDPARPLGLNLIAHDIDHSRHLRCTGLARWSANQRETASKAYLIRAAAIPLMLVWETFNPAVVPRGHHGPTSDPATRFAS